MKDDKRSALSTKHIVEKYLREHEGACYFSWGKCGDSVTCLDSSGKLIDDFMIDMNDGELSYTPVSNHGVSIVIE